MQNKLKHISPLSILSYLLLSIAAIGFGLGLISFVSIGFHDDIFTHHVYCLNRECVGYFLETFDSPLLISKGTLDVLVGIATIGGIIVALLSYLSSASTSALTNHIAHFSVFQSYVAGEIKNRNRLSPSSIDILVWYNLIFSTSRSGKTDVSKDYLEFISELNSLIDQSNSQAVHATTGSFRYKPHQERIINHMKRAGLELYFSPRNDFFEIEGQVFSLIDRINQSFCYSNTVPTLHARNYI
jgi:hypothetical protein